MAASSVSLRHLTCQVAEPAGSSYELEEASCTRCPPETKGSGEEPVWLACSVQSAAKAGYVAHGFYPGQAASHQSTPACPVTAPSAPLRHRHHADQADLRAPLLSVIGRHWQAAAAGPSIRMLVEWSGGGSADDQLWPSYYRPAAAF